MAAYDSLRWQLLGAIASGALLGAGCGGSTSDERAQTPTTLNTDAGKDATTPPPSCSGTLEQSCYSREQLENRVRHGTGQIPLEPPRSDAEVAAAFLPNGCAKHEFVADGCCNPALGEGTPANDGCCYTHCTGACCGRPLLVGGTPRVAPDRDRSDWLAPQATHSEITPKPDLAAAFLEDALLEHASVAAFARFTLELLAIGAPASFVADAQRAGLDEVEHARDCFALASRFCGRDVGPGTLDLSGVRFATDLASIVDSVMREGCVGETIGAAVLCEQAAGAEDVEVRAILERIAEDERRHAELAWRFVAWALKVGGPPLRQVAERVIRDVSADIPASERPVTAVPQWRYFGRLTAAERVAVERRVRTEVIAPAFEALLARTAPPSTRAAYGTSGG